MVEPYDSTTPKLIHPFLDGFSPEDLKVLASCAMPVDFLEGELIFKQGDPANRFYCILAGRVDLQATGRVAQSLTVQTLGAGDVLGWSWTCPPYELNFDARAMEPTRAIFFYATRLREKCEQDTGLGYALMKRISEVMMDRLQATHRALLRRGKTRKPLSESQTNKELLRRWMC